MMKPVLNDLFALWVFLTVGLCGGFFLNQLRDVPLPLIYASKMKRIDLVVNQILQETQEHSNQPEPSQSPSNGEIRYLRLTEFLKIKQEPNALVLDARPEIFHRLGHIPNALSLPREEFEASYNKQKDVLEKAKSHPLIIYCSGAGCEDASTVAGALQKLGFTNVSLLQGGWQEWQQANLPQETSK